MEKYGIYLCFYSIRRYVILITCLLLCSCSNDARIHQPLPISINSSFIGFPSHIAEEMRLVLLEEWDKYSATAHKMYNLDIEIEKYSNATLVQTDNTVTRNTITLVLRYKLNGMQNGKIVSKDSITVFAGYNLTNSHYSNYQADEEITRRLLYAAVVSLRERMRLINL